MIPNQAYRNRKLPPSVSIIKKTNYRGYMTQQQNNNKCINQNMLVLNAMPSIYCNQTSLFSPRQSQKLQQKILNELVNENDIKEWKLYMRKSQFLKQNIHFKEIETFLLKYIKKLNRQISSKQNKQQQQQRYQRPIGKQCLDRQSICNISNEQISKFGWDKLSGIKYNQQISKYSQKIKEDQSLISFLNLQKCILQKKVQVYQQKLLETIQKEQKIDLKDQDLKEREQNLSIMKQKNKFENQAQLRRIQNETIIRQYISLSKQNQKLKTQLDNQNQVIVDLLSKTQKLSEYIRYKELWLMLTEQFIVLKEKYLQAEKERENSVKKLSIARQKNRHLIKSFNLSNGVNLYNQQEKYQLEYAIKNFREWLKVISVPRIPINVPEAEKNVIGNLDQLKKVQFQDEGQDQLNYKLLRPSFYIYFEAYESSILSEKIFAQYRNLESSFYLKIRGILDSMYNQFLIQNYTEWVSFSEFVIGYLEKYTINPIKRTPQLRRKPLQNQERINFLIDLFNKKASNTWECDLFRSFFLEEYTLDQIFFFLDCRNQINRGPTLQRGLHSSDQKIYVKIERAMQMVIGRLQKYDKLFIQKIQNMLHLKKKYKNGHYLVDSNFVLKILLQIYSLQKIKSQKIFYQSFTNKGKTLKITFYQYHTFMTKNFKFMSSGQIAKLYRQIYFLSSGKITYKVIHYICGLKGLFIPLLWKNKPQKACDARSLGDDMLFLNVQNQITRVIVNCQQIGIQSVNNCQLSFSQFLRDSQWLRSNKSLFYRRLMNQLIGIIKIKVYLDWQSSNIQNSPINRQSVRILLNNIITLLHQSDDSISSINQQKQLKIKAIKMLTKNFKIRINQSYQQFKGLKKIVKQIDKINKQQQDNKIN